MKAIVFLVLVILGGAILLGIVLKELDHSRSELQTLREQLLAKEAALADSLAQIKALEQKLQSVQLKLDRAITDNQSLAAERDQFLAEIGSLRMRKQEPEQAQQAAQPQNAASCVQPSDVPQPPSLGTMLVFMIVLAVGYWGFRRTGHMTGKPRVSPAALPAASPKTTVEVNVPREWMSDYAYWVRRMQLTKPIPIVGQDQQRVMNGQTGARSGENRG